MKININLFRLILLVAALSVLPSCAKLLDEPPENKAFTEQTDYTNSGNMILPLYGAYADLYNTQWENFPVISVRGDDVNAGGQGDQQDLTNEDLYSYNKDFWMFNSVWQNFYTDIFNDHSAMDQIALYKEFASNPALADQYIAEIKVMRARYLFQLSRIWGGLLVPHSSDPSELLVAPITSKDDVMRHISDQMDEAIPDLPAMHPSERTDVRGGITKYTALAIKALANLELKDYQAVADATSQIISSGEYVLEPDYYELFKVKKGKLNRENILELQYSDFGQGTGDNYSYLYEFFGPVGWTPSVTGAGGGWGFWEPSMKYIKFMLDRGETVRLETSVIFTNRGIAAIKSDPAYATLPAWITNTTRSGDRFNDFAREMFVSGKHYLPSSYLTPGRTTYGTNNNFICIRYAEILLMHAEALKQGATSSVMTAEAAVNLVRARAGLTALGSVTLDDVMDEKYAELAMEWGTRFYDMVRLGRTAELSYDGRTYTEAKAFLPYPQNQVDLLPPLQGK
jgi:starch-binding outer membrane protein, SusD/RagB family